MQLPMNIIETLLRHKCTASARLEQLEDCVQQRWDTVSGWPYTKLTVSHSKFNVIGRSIHIDSSITPCA